MSDTLECALFSVKVSLRVIPTTSSDKFVPFEHPQQSRRRLTIFYIMSEHF